MTGSTGVTTKMKMSPRDTDFIETEARFGSDHYHLLGVILSRGEDVWVWDAEGSRYLDWLSAYSAVNERHRRGGTASFTYKLFEQSYDSKDLAIGGASPAHPNNNAKWLYRFDR
jgi:hypothetical protein